MQPTDKSICVFFWYLLWLMQLSFVSFCEIDDYRVFLIFSCNFTTSSACFALDFTIVELAWIASQATNFSAAT